jgi:hypothetical protein
MRYICAIAFVFLQIAFWSHGRDLLPKLGIVPNLPSEKEAAALSFGDTQLYFRQLGLNLQMSGDTFGRSTPLKNYNYKKVREWFEFLDTLDDQSNFMPSAAAYYFSRSQNHKDVTYILDYLEEHSFKDPEHNWWWLSQSIYLANDILGDKQRAIKIAHVLREVKADIPIWARQMEAFLREDLGDKKAAKAIMCETFKTLSNGKDVSDRELDFMLYFFKDRLNIKPNDSDKDISDKIGKIAKTCGFTEVK